MDLVPTGVDGMDEMLGGGIPRGHVVALLGSFGTGKTTFALQFLMQGLINGERGIFITLEEDVESILKTAEGYGWDLRSHLKDKTAAVIKLEPSDAKATATRVKSELPQFIKSFGAQRIAVDSISL
ncbi:MAG: KaiC domain-containing protein, partial [Euryarchaeota archaeon]|nr:KaiC domain-containing protein [Euryarchaeota archaeon]